MEMSAEEFLVKAGLNESLLPGEIKFIKHPSEKEGNSYTIVYDWMTNPEKIRVEVRPGLTGQMPDRKDIGRYALWLQAENFVEFETMH